MNKKETAKLLGLIQAYYPSFKNGRNLDVTINGWQIIFADDPYELVEAALIAYVSTDTKGFPPMPGALKDQMKPKVKETNELEAWHEVRKALTNSMYSSKTEFENLSPLCKKIIGSPSVLREWAMMDFSELDTVIASNFMRNYRTIAQNMRDYEKLPESLKLQSNDYRMGLYDGEE